MKCSKFCAAHTQKNFKGIIFLFLYRFLSVLPPIMLTFDLGTSSAHPHPNSAKEDHTQAYQTTLYLLSHPYFTKGSVAFALVGVVLVYTVWLIRSTLRRMEATSGEGGGGEGKWSSTLLKGHTQVGGWGSLLNSVYSTLSFTTPSQ